MRRRTEEAVDWWWVGLRFLESQSRNITNLQHRPTPLFGEETGKATQFLALSVFKLIEPQSQCLISASRYYDQALALQNVLKGS